MQQDLKPRPDGTESARPAGASSRRIGRRLSRPVRSDLVQMGGNLEVERIGLPRSPLDDVYHRLMRAPWLWFCAVFGGYYMTLNLLFGALYYPDLAGIQNAKTGSFSDAFMFSVQTIATIGYGHLAPASAYINTIVVVESMVGLLSLALWSGIAFARFARPTARILFSRNAVITTSDGIPTLMFRVANGRGNRIVDASISVILLRNERNREGVEWRRQYDLPLVRHRSPVFALSWTVMHRIDAASPLRSLLADTSAEPGAPSGRELGADVVGANAMTDPLDLVVSLTGIDDTFAQSIHAMTTYNAATILEGKRFVDMSGVSAAGRPVLDFSKFDAVVDAD